MNFSSAVPLIGLAFFGIAIGAVWALRSQRRRIGLALTIAGIVLVAYAVWWTFVPE